MSHTPEPQFVTPATVGASVNVPESVTVLITTHLWIYWANIAIRAERRAWSARESAADTEERNASLLGTETEECLVSITAVGNLFYNLQESWKPLLPSVNTKQLPVAATIDRPNDERAWLTEIKDLMGTRGNAAHFRESPKEPEPHPGGSRMSPEHLTFRAENASKAVGLMLDVLARAIQSPSEQMKAWSSSFEVTLANLSQLRDDLAS